MPGSLPTIARREPTSRLNSVDLPTFGRPTMASRGTFASSREGTPVALARDVDFGIGTAAIFTSSIIVHGRRRHRRPASSLWRPMTLAHARTFPVLSPSQPVSSRSTHDVSLYNFFAPGGVLSKTHPAYEFRRGQLQMAQAVEEALSQKRHLIVEAGTGTGKTLAYLLPVIRAGKRVVISTGTKNLQEQLFFKDVPFLERALYPDGQGKLRVSYMKGRNNYLCRKKLYDLADQPVLNGLEEIDQFRAITEWDKTTETGDRAELTVLPESSAVWPKLDARSDTCLGQKCAQYERCFI